jgi:hypothetical protein
MSARAAPSASSAAHAPLPGYGSLADGPWPLGRSCGAEQELRTASGPSYDSVGIIPVGKAELLQNSNNDRVAIFALGSLVPVAEESSMGRRPEVGSSNYE